MLPDPVDTGKALVDEKTCPLCDADLLYEVDGTTYSHTVSVEIQGVYDGGLFYLCPNCEGCWHRWPKGDRLRPVAQVYIDRWNKRAQDKSRGGTADG